MRCEAEYTTYRKYAMRTYGELRCQQNAKYIDDEGRHFCGHHARRVPPSCGSHEFVAGAAVLGGLVGMAVAIKKRQGYQEWTRITPVDALSIRFVDVDLEEDERGF